MRIIFSIILICLVYPFNAYALFGLGDKDDNQLSKEEVALIENGKGSKKQELMYITNCVLDGPCHYGFLQSWSNSDEYPFDAYAAQAADKGKKVPSLMRGTDIETSLMTMFAAIECGEEELCRKYLVDIVKTLRELPPEILQSAYREKSHIDKEKLQRQVASNIKNNVSQQSSHGSTASNGHSTKFSAETSIPHSPGTILDSQRDPISGNYVFLKVAPSGNSEVFLDKGGDGNDVAKLADVSGDKGSYSITTAEGEQIEAPEIKLTWQGLMAGGGGYYRSYSRDGLTEIVFPVGFHAAAIQSSDVFDTGYMLLERDMKKNHGISSPLGSLGKLLGASKSQDYILLNIHTGQTYPINLDNGGKTTSYLYNCRKKNALLNICDDAVTKESLYRQDGFKNRGHYAWLIRWVRTKHDAYLITLEDTLRNLTATRMSDGKKVVVFHRGLGIGDFSVAYNEDDTITIAANLAFSTKTVNDLASVFDSLPVYGEAKKQITKQD